MKVKKLTFFLFFIVFGILSIQSQGESKDKDVIKIQSLDQACQSYLDEPMIADNLYGGKIIETPVKVSDKRKIHSLCSDAQEGTFTAEIIAQDNYVVGCVCNSPNNTGVFDRANPGDVLLIQGTFKSITSTFFEGDTQMCQVTIYNCSFVLKNG